MSNGWIANVQIVDVAEGTCTDPANIRIENGTIADICTQLPQNVKVLLDGGCRWVAPGLIDAHVHLFLAADTQPLATFLASSDEEKFTTALRNASTAIRAGITTVRDCGGPSALVAQFRRGPALGDNSPHLIASGSPLTRPNGHCHFMGVPVASTEDVRTTVEKLFAEGNDFIKIMASGGGLTPGTRPGDADFPYELLCEAVHIAHSNGKLVAAHCHATESITRSVRAGVDVIEHASFVDAGGKHRFVPSLCEEIRDHGIAICPTVSGALRTAAAFSKDGPVNKLDVDAVARLRARVTNAADFYRLGVKLLAGTDSGITQTPFDSLVDELLAHCQAGMSHAEALRSATSDSAKILRLEKLGEVRLGYRADLILLANDPFKDIETLRRPQSVLKAGKVVFSQLSGRSAGVHPQRDSEYSFDNRVCSHVEMTGRNQDQRQGTSAVKPSVIIREPSGAEETERYYDLRWRVLREPWSQERGQERDKHECEAIHVAAWQGERIVGVGRVHFIDPKTAQVRYMAVEPEMQGQGIGSRILEELELRAKQRGAKRIVLNARDRAVHFYDQHGYSITHSSETLFNAIPHWEMLKNL